MDRNATSALDLPLLDAARAVRDALSTVRFPLETTGAIIAADDTQRLLGQLDDHVLPRLADIDAPALVVIGGSTGSGKSLIVNSLVQADVSRSSAIRPTTRQPVLAHHPDDARWFQDARILPAYSRVYVAPDVSRALAEEADPDAPTRRDLRLVANPTVPAGLALLDAPDIDSIDAVNRQLAAELLGAADIWVFVTTAARYADAVPWQFLHRARDRSVPLVLVLNRVPPAARAEVEPHFRSLLADNGLSDATLFCIDEQALVASRIPTAAIEPLRHWLVNLGADHELRAEAVRRSVRGAVTDVMARAHTVADAADLQVRFAGDLRGAITRHYDVAYNEVVSTFNGGAMLRGEVLARWEEFVGTGELMRELRTGIGRIRDRIAGIVTGRPRTAPKLQGAVESVLESLIRSQADGAAAAVLGEWRALPAASALLPTLPPSLGRASTELSARTSSMVREWQGELLELVRSQGANRRSTARFLSLGVNGVSMVLMVLVFSHTGGLTGTEVAVAGGASAVGHALLEALLGDENLRRLAGQARGNLESRVRTLYAAEANRFQAELNRAGIDSTGGTGVREALQRMKRELG